MNNVKVIDIMVIHVHLSSDAVSHSAMSKLHSDQSAYNNIPDCIYSNIITVLIYTVLNIHIII